MESCLLEETHFGRNHFLNFNNGEGKVITPELKKLAPVKFPSNWKVTTFFQGQAVKLRRRTLKSFWYTFPETNSKSSENSGSLEKEIRTGNLSILVAMLVSGRVISQSCRDLTIDFVEGVDEFVFLRFVVVFWLLPSLTTIFVENCLLFFPTIKQAN